MRGVSSVVIGGQDCGGRQGYAARRRIGSAGLSPAPPATYHAAMHFALLFLILAALTAAAFPAWGWPMVLGSAGAAVVVLRLLLMLGGRRGKSAGDAAN